MRSASIARPGPLVAAATLIGIGLGGFADGIVFHQILQWHHMLSSRLPPTTLVNIKVNMIWDGLFHLVTWLSTSLGLLLLWRALGRADVPRSNAVFGGSLALGWGAFNFVEGLVDHQLLGVHHVHPGRGQLAWDVGFVLSGAVLLIAGGLAIRAGRLRSIDLVTEQEIR